MKTQCVPVTKDRFASCIEFLTPREYMCVSLMSQLVVGGKPHFPAKNFKTLMLLENSSTPGKIDGIVGCTRTGIILHCIGEKTDKEQYAAELALFLNKQEILCIIGEHTNSLFIESLINEKPSQTADYQLMTMDTLPSPKKCRLDEKTGAVIKAASLSDAENLLPLQEGYELEEVIPPGGPFSRKACEVNLKLGLESQRIWAVWTNGQCIAKAGTNARGLAWDQIGGVYTMPEWRGKGIASALVAFISREMMNENRKIALFVKLTNVYAQKAYKKAGFLQKTLFRITYYHL